jgi:hypothetical protein
MQLNRVGRHAALAMLEVEETDAGDLDGRIHAMPRGRGVKLAGEL